MGITGWRETMPFDIIYWEAVIKIALTQANRDFKHGGDITPSTATFYPPLLAFQVSATTNAAFKAWPRIIAMTPGWWVGIKSFSRKIS